MMQAQLRSLTPWLAYLGVGAVLYGLLAVSGSYYATSRDLPRWETVVTFCEWGVALLFLPRILIIARSDEVVRPGSRRLVQFVADAAWVSGALLVFSVVTRALLGLGFKPF